MTVKGQAERPGGSEKGAEAFEKANAEYDSSDFRRALELYDEALAGGMESEVLYNNRGASLDALGNGPEAIESYRRAVAIRPGYELAWHNLGNSYFGQELFSKAARAYSKAASLKPERRENISGLASSQIRIGHPHLAKMTIAKLDRAAASDPKVLLLQADLYLDAGIHDLAEEVCRKFIDMFPDDVEGYVRLGNIEHEMGVYGKAIDSYEKALAKAPNDKELWNNLGYSSFVAGFLDKAIESFDRALAIDPQYKHAWYNKGYAYHGADMLEQAVECYGKAIAIDSRDRVLWNNLGNALYNLGRYGESIPKFVEAIRVDPDYEIAWNNIGNALEKMGEYANAIPFHDRSLEISPDFDYAMYAKGVCMAHTGRPEEGYDLVLESLGVNPEYDEAWNARSTIARQMGRLDDALQSVEEALSINPDFDQGWANRGELMLISGDVEAAEASFEMALQCLERVRPDTPGGMAAVVRRGEVLMRLGRFEEALANLEFAAVSKRINPKNSLMNLFRLRRLLGKPDLPKALGEVAERTHDPDVQVEHARFLIDHGMLDYAKRVLDAMGDEPGLESRKKALMGALVSTEATAALEGSESSGADQFLSMLLLARSCLAEKDPEGCVAAAEAALGIDPLDWEPHALKAEAYSSLGQADRADKELQHARALLRSANMNPDEILKSGGNV